MNPTAKNIGACEAVKLLASTFASVDFKKLINEARKTKETIIRLLEKEYNYTEMTISEEYGRERQGFFNKASSPFLRRAWQECNARYRRCELWARNV